MSRIRRVFRPLALLAIVLLATVPTVGRMASAGSGVSPARSVAAAMSAMHHMPGMAHATHDMAAMPAHGAMPMHDMPMHDMPMHEMPGHDMPGHAMAADAHDAAPPMPHPGGDAHAGHQIDCDYCPLLHSLLGALAIVLLTTHEDALPAPPSREIAAALPWHHPTGLGSRGPPIAL